MSCANERDGHYRLRFQPCCDLRSADGSKVVITEVRKNVAMIQLVTNAPPRDVSAREELLHFFVKALASL